MKSMRVQKLAASSSLTLGPNLCQSTWNPVVCSSLKHSYVLPSNACRAIRASTIVSFSSSAKKHQFANRLPQSAASSRDNNHLHARTVNYPENKSEGSRQDDSQHQPKSNEIRFINLDDEFIDDENAGAVKAAEADDDVLVIPHRQRARWYENQIKAFARLNRLDEALRFFDIRMKKQDQVTPTFWIYFQLIAACGVAGYLDRAFELFNEMKSRHYIGDRRDPRIISSLFNACAECPFKEKALTKTKYFYERLISERWEFDITNYNAVMKAFARHGDLISAFGIVDRLESEGLARDAITVQTLLSACLSDKETGFKFAVEVWRFAAGRRSFKFDNQHYQILLRILRECGVGDDTFAQDLIRNKSKISMLLLQETQQQELQQAQTDSHLSSSVASPTDSNQSDSTSAFNEVNVVGHSVVNAEMNELLNSENRSVENTSAAADDEKLQSVRIPDILQTRLRYDVTLKINSLSKPAERLALLGGPEGIIQRMHAANLEPDAIIFNEMLQSLESSVTAEHNLMELMRTQYVSFDVSFFNLLLSKRVKRREVVAARDAVHMMHHCFVTPNEQTFGCLAFLCANETDARQFLSDLEKCDVQLNEIMLAPMLSIALNSVRFGYAVMIMELFLTRIGHAPPVAVRYLEKFFNKHLRHINQLENLTPAERRRRLAGAEPGTFLYGSESFLQNFYRFKDYYFQWLKRVQAQQPEHPWQRFQQHLKEDEEISNDDKRIRNNENSGTNRTRRAVRN